MRALDRAPVVVHYAGTFSLCEHIQMTEIRKTFGDTEVLRGVDLTVAADAGVLIA